MTKVYKEKVAGILLAGCVILLSGCGNTDNGSQEASQPAAGADGQEEVQGGAGGDAGDVQGQTDFVTEGTEEYRGFILDNVLHSESEGEIHYNLYVPESYDGSEPYALFFTLPGYEGLYFQGVGVNLYSEDFGFTAREYIPDMIIAAPQLEDWGETSADQTIALAEYFLANYNIDESRVYAEGYSGGGETMSRVMGKRPELFTAYLQCSSQWDGAYENLYGLYREAGLSDEEISELLVLDIKDAEYFESQGMTNQHGGGNLFAADEEIMGWLFSR